MSQGDARRLGARFTAKTVRVTNGAVLDDLREDWIALAGRASEHAMCQTFAYCRAAYDLGVPNDGTAWLLTVFEGSKLAAVWLLQTTREGLFQFLWPLGSGSNDEYGGPLLQMDGERELSQQILAEAVKLRADVFQVFVSPPGRSCAGRWRIFNFQDLFGKRDPWFVISLPLPTQRPGRRSSAHDRNRFVRA